MNKNRNIEKDTPVFFIRRGFTSNQKRIDVEEGKFKSLQPGSTFGYSRGRILPENEESEIVVDTDRIFEMNSKGKEELIKYMSEIANRLNDITQNHYDIYIKSVNKKEAVLAEIERINRIEINE